MSHDFLVEIGTEELPPKSLKLLITAFGDSIKNQCADLDLTFESLQSFASARRIAILIKGLPATTPRKELSIWGPPAKIAFDQDGNPSKAATAFAQKNGVSVSDLTTENDGKADKLLCRTTAGAEDVKSLMPGTVSKALDGLPIEKRMRWGASREEFVRPVHWIVMLFDSDVIEGSILGVSSYRLTRGHRFHSEGDITISHAALYEESLLQQGKVIADFNKRQSIILDQIQREGESLGGATQIDQDLLDEVTALVEWPVTLSGRFEERFLSVPAEALISSMKEHQKYFHVNNSQDQLMPYFITVSNIDSKEPQKIIEGNEKVIRPRLADASFFFEEDKKNSLESRREQLKSVVFQSKLGTLLDKTQRIENLAKTIAQDLQTNVDNAVRAAKLCKTDLLTSMVYEFPELQGVAGSYYAQHDGENSEVAIALREQYLPKFAGDHLAVTDAGNIVGLADRIDTLVGIFGLGQHPTGSKDPFALRRASLSILRILIEKSYDLDLKDLLYKAYNNYGELPQGEPSLRHALSYILDRFKAWYIEAGFSAEVFQAVAAKQLSHPIDIDKRIKAVAAFSSLEQAPALAAANKRVSNILAKIDLIPKGRIDETLLIEDAEKALAAKLAEVQALAEPLFAKRDYTEGLSTLAALRDTVDTFFDKVMVMTDDEKIKHNRLVLLSQLRALFFEVADISALAVTK